MDAGSAQRWMAVSGVAATQHGRVALWQLRSCGIGKGAVEKAVRSGRLHQEHRGVYVVGHVAPGRLGRWIGCVLACGDGALLSHRSAATLWGIRDGEGRDVDITVPTRDGRRPRRGIRVHRSRLHPDDAGVLHGIPVTSAARTLTDLAREVGEDELVRAVREAQYRRVFDLTAVEAALARRPSRVLARVLGDATPATSPLEDRFLRLLDRHRIRRPEGQVPIDGHRVDFLWPQERVVAELDGIRAHGTADAFQRDRSQTNALQLAGYLVLRFTAADLRRRPGQVARLVREALGRVRHP